MGLKFLLAAILLTGGIASRWIAFDDDEFQHAHMAWLLARGEVPHRDFFEHHLPLHHLLLAPFTLGNPGPDRILLLRALSVLTFAGSIWTLYKVLQHRTAVNPLPITLLVAVSPIFFLKMIEVRPEGFCILLALLSMRALDRGGPKNTFLAGFMAAAMVMASQKFLFLAGGIFLFCAWEHGFRPLLRFSVAGLIPPVLTATAYLLLGAGPAAWQHLVVLNAQWQETFSPGMYAGMLWETSGVLTALALVGVCFPRSSVQRPAYGAAVCLLLAGIVAVLVVPIPFRQTFLMLYPGLALAAVLGWERIIEVLPHPRFHTPAVVLFTLAAIAPGLQGIRREFSETLHEDRALMHHLQATTEGPVFDARGLVYWRHHVGEYAWMHDGLMMMLDPEIYSQATQTALRAADFPPLLWDYRVADTLPESLQRFLRNHYLPTEPAPLMLPGMEVDRSQLMGSGRTVDLPAPGTWEISWQGGEVWVDQVPVENPGRFTTETPHIHLRGRGFVRNLRILRVEATP